MALTQYDNIVVSNPEGGFINIRKEPEDKGIDNICGKFTKGSGAELLDKVSDSGGSWYKIKSGSVTGYVKSDYCITGQAAKDMAVNYAVLTAFIRVDSLNVRSEPSLDGKVWTSVTRNQAYSVIGQTDGWVELEMKLMTGLSYRPETIMLRSDTVCRKQQSIILPLRLQMRLRHSETQ